MPAARTPIGVLGRLEISQAPTFKDILASFLAPICDAARGSGPEGGPGSGSVLVTNELADFLPDPVVAKRSEAYSRVTPAKTIGRLNGYAGSFGIVVRAYTYIRLMGLEGIYQAPRTNQTPPAPRIYSPLPAGVAIDSATHG